MDQLARAKELLGVTDPIDPDGESDGRLGTFLSDASVEGLLADAEDGLLLADAYLMTEGVAAGLSGSGLPGRS